MLSPVRSELDNSHHPKRDTLCATSTYLGEDRTENEALLALWPGMPLGSKVFFVQVPLLMSSGVLDALDL